AGDDKFVVTPGATPDAGTLTGFRPGAGGFAFTPTDFRGFSQFIDINAVSPGGNDTLIANGSAADDTFQFSSSDSAFPTAGSLRVNGHTPIFTNQANWVLRGTGGDDTFNLNYSPLGTRFQPASIRIEGGDPSGSDALNITLAASVTATIGPSASNEQEQAISGLATPIVSAS